MVSSSAQILSQYKIRFNFKDTFSVNAYHGDWSNHSVVKQKKSLRFSYQLRRFRSCCEKRPILGPHFAATQSEVTHSDRILRQRKMRLVEWAHVLRRNSDAIYGVQFSARILKYRKLWQYTFLAVSGTTTTAEIAVNVWDKSKFRYLLSWERMIFIEEIREIALLIFRRYVSKFDSVLQTKVRKNENLMKLWHF